MGREIEERKSFHFEQQGKKLEPSHSEGRPSSRGNSGPHLKLCDIIVIDMAFIVFFHSIMFVFIIIIWRRKSSLHLVYSCTTFLCYLDGEIYRWSMQRSKCKGKRSSRWVTNYPLRCWCANTTCWVISRCTCAPLNHHDHQPLNHQRHHNHDPHHLLNQQPLRCKWLF